MWLCSAPHLPTSETSSPLKSQQSWHPLPFFPHFPSHHLLFNLSPNRKGWGWCGSPRTPPPMLSLAGLLTTQPSPLVSCPARASSRRHTCCFYLLEKILKKQKLGGSRQGREGGRWKMCSPRTEPRLVCSLVWRRQVGAENPGLQSCCWKGLSPLSLR